MGSNNLDFSSVLKDPDFLALSTIEKRKFLLSTNADFASLPVAEQSKFIISLTSPKERNAPGFTESLFRPLGVSGPTEAAQEIAKTLTMLGRATGLHSGPDIENLRTGASEFFSQSAKGLAQQVGRTAMALPPLLNISMAMGKVPRLEEVTAPFGGQEIAQASRQLGRGEYAGAAGSFTAALLEALPFLGRKPLTRLSTKAAESFEPVAKGALLASGERVPTTLGVASGKAGLVSIEKLAGQVWGGGTLRTQAARLRQASSNVIDRIAQRTAQRAGAVGVSVTGVPADTFELAGKTLRQKVAAPLYAEIDAAMSAKGAEIPAANALKEFAQKEVQRMTVQRLLTNPDVATVVKGNLDRMAITPLAATAGPGEEISGKIFQGFRDSVSDLKAAQRALKVRGDRAGVRTLGEMLKRMTQSMEQALDKTQPGLTDRFRQANAIYAQGANIEEFAEDVIRKSAKGTKPGIMSKIPGVRERPMMLSGSRLVESLKTAEHEGTLKRAIPNPADAKTLQQVAELLDRTRESASIAAKFANLAVMRGATLPILAGFYGGVGMGERFLVGEVLGAYIVAKALGSPRTAKVLMQFLKASPNSAAELSLASRLNRLTKEEN